MEGLRRLEALTETTLYLAPSHQPLAAQVDRHRLGNTVLMVVRAVAAVLVVAPELELPTKDMLEERANRLAVAVFPVVAAGAREELDKMAPAR
jgi:hypothetical protein